MEHTLSDNILESDDYANDYHIRADDVMVFIKDLKNEIDELGDYAKADVVSLALIKTIKGVIDNFAGDKLV